MNKQPETVPFKATIRKGKDKDHRQYTAIITVPKIFIDNQIYKVGHTYRVILEEIKEQNG